jgi:hypothetical protein
MGVQLATTQKGDMSMAEYYNRMKNLADTMSSIGQPLSSAEIVSYVLAGLDNSYDALVTSLTSRTEDVTIGAHLMSYEARHPTRDDVFQHSANNAMRGRGRGVISMQRNVNQNIQGCQLHYPMVMSVH